MDHPDDIETMRWFYEKTVEMMEVAGASNIVGHYERDGQEGNVHLLGTCRMGNDPDSSVVDAMNGRTTCRISSSATAVTGDLRPRSTHHDHMALAFPVN